MPFLQRLASPVYLLTTVYQKQVRTRAKRAAKEVEVVLNQQLLGTTLGKALVNAATQMQIDVIVDLKAIAFDMATTCSTTWKVTELCGVD